MTEAQKRADKAWRERNPELVRHRVRQYYLRNKEKVLNRQKAHDEYLHECAKQMEILINL